MLIQRVNRTDPEKIFILVKNSYSTAALSNGQASVFDYATDADGVSVTLPTDATGRASHYGTAFAGIVAEAIAISDYGLVQTYGYHSAVRVRTHTGGNPAIAAGTALSCKDAVFCLASAPPNGAGATSTVTVANYQWCGFALAAQASWTTKAIAVFIKAM